MSPARDPTYAGTPLGAPRRCDEEPLRGSLRVGRDGAIVPVHEDAVVVEGDFTLIDPDHPTLYAFARTLGNERMSVYANLSDDPLALTLDPADAAAELVLGNYADAGAPDTLRPWEARILRTPTAG